MTDVTVTLQDDAVFALIDGQRFDDIELVSSVDAVLDRFEQSDTGEWYKFFTPGRVTHAIWHEGNVIFQTHNTPVMRDDGDSIAWAWSSQ